ncbi:hypothetical protein BOTBODRAFT_251129 [Botryobasidium botryosum FD-172 SS1]|uniref:Uncharacterized protein n=1 Tax=Botryobasidium botryosum (strain FD-172 SS1) TaxID=930990 RepID=A0A067MY85_BOTB1|nr:hypothetical protein BOTBODRAFT_251129 [Botryobasidium botryosum FD-172 SS1]
MLVHLPSYKSCGERRTLFPCHLFLPLSIKINSLVAIQSICTSKLAHISLHLAPYASVSPYHYRVQGAPRPQLRSRYTPMSQERKCQLTLCRRGVQVDLDSPDFLAHVAQRRWGEDTRAPAQYTCGSARGKITGSAGGACSLRLNHILQLTPNTSSYRTLSRVRSEQPPPSAKIVGEKVHDCSPATRYPFRIAASPSFHPLTQVAVSFT